MASTEKPMGARVDAGSKGGGLPPSASAIAALFYVAAVMVAAERVLGTMFERHGGAQFFASPALAMVFLRVMAGVWALVFLGFQALVLGLLFLLSTRTRRVAFREGCSYVLLGQIPFMLAVFSLYAFGGFDAASLIGQQWIHHVIGAVTSLVYAILAARGRQVNASHIAAFLVLSIAANSAVLLLSGQVGA